MSRLPAITGWLWIKQGFALFRKQPAILTMLLFATLLFSLTLSTIPLLGQMITMVLVPSFSMAILQACNLIGQDQPVTPGVLLTGFRQPALRRLCKLGLVYLGLSILLGVMLALMISPEFIKQMSVPLAERAAQKISTADMQAVLLTGLLQSMALLALCFAPPLTYWQQMSPGKAIFYSVFGIFGAIRPFMVMLLAWSAMFFGASIMVMLLLGDSQGGRIAVIWLMLQFVLLLQCAIFCSYRQIFGDPSLLAKEAALK
ncbi:BPSS1780 family membrane protein [Massilia pseudoviolaceinigra]|uniref:BPSS1780 family membrane protein n=1 Tax=Massilia pseudoviolaceinigra TaxID=3057165 RepID=UPI0027966DE0|nr:BPSS1780 family membrane protein [Massilia sp. CCM 9206]MDQ1922218.1 BPSS1780 family membrane protein [Massilia sp. CCM 9206]